MKRSIEKLIYSMEKDLSGVRCARTTERSYKIGGCSCVMVLSDQPDVRTFTIVYGDYKISIPYSVGKKWCARLSVWYPILINILF